MLTPAGIVMSERAARIYKYINERGVHLTTFSTDQDVLRNVHQLGRILSDLETGTHALDYPKWQIDQMIADLTSILRRVPANRSR